MKTTPTTPSYFDSIPAPVLKDLIVALGKASQGVRSVHDVLGTWTYFEQLDSKKLAGRWKKLIFKLGAALRDMFSKEGMPAILQRLRVSAPGLADRETVVKLLEDLATDSASLTQLLGNLLLYEKREYYSETTGAVTDIRMALKSNLTSPEERLAVKNVSKQVLAVSDEMAKEPVDSRKANKKIAAETLQKAEEAKINPAMDAQALQIKVMEGGSITAEDLTKDAAKQGSRRSNTVPSGSGTK